MNPIDFFINPIFTLVISILSIIFSACLINSVLKEPIGGKKEESIALAIQEGSRAFLKREYFWISLVGIFIAIIFYFLFGFKTSLGFLLGAFFSALAGFIGMNVSVRANVRVVEGAKKGLKKALDISFKGGAITGLLVISLALFSLSFFYLIFRDLASLVALGFGGSLISLFARVGGGIYTKAADIGADLVGKVEAKIPEDDPRNPAVIADNVGDNVGDCAGMSADLFESFVVTAVGAMILANILFENEKLIILPLTIGSAGLVSSIVGTFFVKLDRTKKISRALYKGLFASGILGLLIFFYIFTSLIENLSFFFASIIGLAITLFLFIITDFYTSKASRPVREIAQASKTGPATNIITGLAIGFEATFLPILVFVIGLILAFVFGGLFGIALASVSMLSLTGLIIALDAYGPITDNAAGISQMSALPKKIRKVLDSLDAVGNTTKAVTKAYAIGSAVLGSLVLFVVYLEDLKKINLFQNLTFDLTDPRVLIGLLLGGVIPFLFSALALKGVGKAASQVIVEVRNQFRTIKGILEGVAKPDYARAVDIVTKAALKEMIKPALLAVISPLVVGFILGPIALGGFLFGLILTGVFVAIFMTTGGAALDNAKKYIEEGAFGGKGSEAHSASVIGDTVGDPYKDTAGPAINPLIKVINTVAIIFSSLIVLYSLNIF